MKGIFRDNVDTVDFIDEGIIYCGFPSEKLSGVIYQKVDSKTNTVGVYCRFWNGNVNGINIELQ